jgi:hypothetical protein
MRRVDAVVLAEKKTDGSGPDLPEFLEVRRDHRIALQPALAERERGHVPPAVGLGEINPEPDRFRGGEPGHHEQREE